MLDVALSVDRPRFRVEAAFRLGPGERLGLYGPSGSGKSTILDAVAGLVPLASGRVVLDGRDCTGAPLWQRRVGLVRQRPALFPHLTVRANVAYGAPKGSGGAEEAALCDRLGITALLDAYPNKLSGGQAQRVALARALRAPSAALLLDEPFQGLDPPLRRELAHLVREVAAERALPVVLVAHELDEVQAFAERIGILESGQLLQLAGAAEVVRRPATAQVALLVGYAAVVGSGRPGEQIGLHPDLLRLGAFPALGPVLWGVVRSTRPSGLRSAAEVEVAGTVVTLACDAPPGAPGDEVELTAVDPPRFGRDGVLLGPPPAAATTRSSLAPSEPARP